MRVIAAAGGEYGVANARAVFADREVPEAQDAESHRLQVGCASRIVGDSRGVLSAIQFDDETCLLAEKIDDVAALRDLATPLPTAEPAVAQDVPEETLSGCVAAAQASRAICQFGVRHSAPLT